MYMDGEKQRRYSVVLVWLTLETVNIGTLWESGTLDMDILHCTVCIRRHHAVLTSLPIPGTEVRRGNFEGREKLCGKHHRNLILKYLFLMSGAQCGDGC